MVIILDHGNHNHPARELSCNGKKLKLQLCPRKPLPTPNSSSTVLSAHLYPELFQVLLYSVTTLPDQSVPDRKGDSKVLVRGAKVGRTKADRKLSSGANR